MLVTCGIYLYDTRQQRILVCHATGSSWKQWSIPKGLKSEGEQSLDAARRELKEETGIDTREINVVKILQLPTAKYQKQNKTLESFLLVTDSDLGHHVFTCKSLGLNAVPEVDSWKWITFEQAETWLHESQQRNIESVRKLVLQNSS
jgi:predicted NUDIX family NTP pyrophosphohydrolase